jgi:hypothetical protein
MLDTESKRTDDLAPGRGILVVALAVWLMAILFIRTL